ncbi:ABC transporter ATP-binding protein [Bacillus salitolerans]|uniref:ABC transporter ATP-binding protein n=1 Tax=Bacillus salitolerans TaxID=1437434 RepID=A0ABW4LV61_9BACI
MASISFRNVAKKFGKDTVIENLNLEIKDGSFTVLVGPSGCGKSTTLRMLAGLEVETSGEIEIDGKSMKDVQPGQRDVAMVFQNYAIYPTMTVRENIEFGLKNRKVPKKERDQLIQEIAEIVGLSDYLSRKPSTLSGGQRQRVALCRAMVKKPKVFLMDEPLSNLDAKLRTQMRTELIQLHKRLGTTFVYVTHDQVEAMSMGDQIVIMNKGEIQQVASPVELYNNPSNTFTAQFIGTPPMNLLDSHGLLASSLKENVHQVGFRPEKVSFEAISDGLTLNGKIVTRETLGSETIYQIETELGMFMVKSFTEPLSEGSNVSVNIRNQDLYYFDKLGNRMYDVRSEREELAVVGGSVS